MAVLYGCLRSVTRPITNTRYFTQWRWWHMVARPALRRTARVSVQRLPSSCSRGCPAAAGSNRPPPASISQRLTLGLNDFATCGRRITPRDVTFPNKPSPLTQTHLSLHCLAVRPAMESETAFHSSTPRPFSSSSVPAACRCRVTSVWRTVSSCNDKHAQTQRTIWRNPR